MENFEKILELLDRQNLTEEEKLSLVQLADSDEELKSFISVYKNINSTLSAPGHIPIDLLTSFVLSEKGDESENKLVEILKDKIMSHLAECSICKNEYNSLLNEYSEIQEHVGKSINRDSKVTVKESDLILSSLLKRTNALRYAFATLAVFIVAYLGLFIISTSITPDYKKNIFSENQEDFYKTRGRTSPQFQQGLNAIDNQDYLNAIEFLSMDIKEHQNEKSIFYSHYIIGITYIQASESDYLGLFKSYDRDEVNLAIANLKESIDKNNSGDYESLKLNSYYYLGRAYLLIDDRDSAIANFLKVINGKGKYSIESSQLINQLENN
ncbi:MAG: hypothetical protein OEM46_00195 [Ignavibacteria bacterium]|nr:hypothetical protein [Ignavibacteria bacterium]